MLSASEPRVLLRYLRLSLIVLPCLIASSAKAFVILSGSENATLKSASPTSPTVTFHWDGSAPPLENLDQLEGGKWAHLSDTEAMEQIIRLALSKWNDIPASYVQLAMETDLDASADSEDEQHAIIVAADSNATTAAFALPSVVDKKIVDCDITLGATSTSAVNLAYTIVHELGHCLGLGHNHTNYASIMGYSRSDRNLKLGADDRAGIIFLYPDPDYLPRPHEPLACGSLPASMQRPEPPSSLPPALLLLPLALALLALLWTPGRKARGTAPA